MEQNKNVWFLGKVQNNARFVMYFLVERWEIKECEKGGTPKWEIKRTSQLGKDKIRLLTKQKKTMKF